MYLGQVVSKPSNGILPIVGSRITPSSSGTSEASTSALDYPPVLPSKYDRPHSGKLNLPGSPNIEQVERKSCAMNAPTAITMIEQMKSATTTAAATSVLLGRLRLGSPTLPRIAPSRPGLWSCLAVESTGGCNSRPPNCVAPV